MHLTVIDDEAGLVELRPAWDELLNASRQSSPFLAFDWLHTWWKTHAPAGRLHVLVLSDADGCPLGVLPMFTAPFGRVVRARAGRLLADRGVGSTALGPFARTDVEDEVLARFEAYLREGKHGWDVVDLAFLDTSSSFYSLTRDSCGSAVSGASGVCPSIDLPGEWDAYLSTLPRGKACEVRRCMRRAEEHGVELEVVTEPEELPRAIEDLLRLHEQRMRFTSGPDYSVPASYRAFVSQMAATLMSEKRLSLLFLKLGDERVAATYQLRHRDAMVAQLCAFVPVEGLPNVLRPLLAHTIRAAIDQGCSVFDMHLGDQKYKFEWGVSSIRQYGRIRFYGASIRARARRLRDGIAAKASA